MLKLEKQKLNSYIEQYGLLDERTIKQSQIVDVLVLEVMKW